ncbi:hypothetical protein N9W17_00320 [Jannaschia sp.]|nr:hypothetical protein [Jannaschia sp.]
MPGEEVHLTLEQVWREPEADRTSLAGRHAGGRCGDGNDCGAGRALPLSDDQIEDRGRDRLSVLRVLRLARAQPGR